MDKEQRPGVTAVERWIYEQNPSFDRALEPDEDLFELGLITSLDILELMVVIERSGGSSVVRSDLETTNFTSLGVMSKKFFDEP